MTMTDFPPAGQPALPHGQLRVMQVLPGLDTGGAERGCVDVAAATARAGGYALVVSSGGRLVPEVERQGGVHVTLPVDSKNPLTIWRNAEKLAALVRRHGINIIHARSRAPAWSAERAAQLTGAHYMTTFHAAYGTNGPFKKRYNAVMARGERVIAISHFIAGHVKETYGAGDDRIRVVQRGIDIRAFDPDRVSADRVAKLAHDWQLPDGKPVVALPGRLTRIKGHIPFIKAVAALGRRDFVALFIGSDQGRTGYRQELIELIKVWNLEGVVRLVDHCSDMPAAYKLSDVVITTSTKPEGFGRTVVEAQAMGRPVITSNIGASGETIIADETGFVVPPDDVPALAAALGHALSLGREDRLALADRARRHVAANFTTARMCEQTLAVYQELAG